MTSEVERRIKTAEELARVNTRLESIEKTLGEFSKQMASFMATKHKMEGAKWMARFIGAAAIGAGGAIVWLLKELVRLAK